MANAHSPLLTSPRSTPPSSPTPSRASLASRTRNREQSDLWADTEDHFAAAIGTLPTYVEDTPDRRKSLWKERLSSVFVCSTWLPRYSKTWLKGDLVAGLTVGIVVVPQGMAYAQLANLPPQYGLYAAFLGQLTYWLTGTSKDISVGPVAVVSTLVGSILSKADVGSLSISLPELASSMCFAAGLVVTLMSVLRLGWLVEFIPVPATTAFVTGSAIDISARQLPSLLGLTLSPVEDRRPTYAVIWAVLKDIFSGEVVNADVVVGILSLVQLYAMKQGLAHLSRRWEKGRTLCFFLATLRAVVTLLLWTLMSFSLNHGAEIGTEWIHVLGNVPSGFPSVKGPRLGMDVFRIYGRQLPALVIVLLVEHLSIANSFARLNRYPINANSELLSIGLTNTLSSFLHSYPITGSFSRTAIASKSGAKTPLNGVFGALIVLCAIFYAGAFYYIPTAAMSAVIIHAVADLCMEGIHTAMEEFKTWEIAVWALGVMIALIWDVETAIYVSTGVLLLRFLRRQARPHEIRVDVVSSRNSVLRVEVRGRLEYPNATRTMARVRDEMDKVVRRRGAVEVVEVWLEGEEEDWDVGCKRAVTDCVQDMEGEGWEVRMRSFQRDMEREMGDVNIGGSGTFT